MFKLKRTNRMKGYLMGQTWILLIFMGLIFLVLGTLDYVYQFWFKDGSGGIIIALIGAVILIFSMVPRLLDHMTPLGAWSLGIMIITILAVVIVIIADVLSLGGILNG